MWAARSQAAANSTSPQSLPSGPRFMPTRSEEHTSELQSHHELVCRLLLEKKNDLLAVGAIASFGLVTRGVGQSFEVAAVQVGLEDVHVAIEIPLVASALAVLPVLAPLPIL